MTESDAMKRALALALEGWGRVAPNPLVGAVLLRNGGLVGEGWHAEYGGRHAEAEALARCDDPRGATCVVTLEPCAHRGKTPPCADALIAAGVAKVVIAVPDPTPEARGGADRLRDAGIEVAVGPGAPEAAAANAAFLWANARPDRPFVALKLATSVDGFLADGAGRSRWISGPEAREYVHWLRAGFDGIAVGAGTVAKDDPALTVRGSIQPRRPPVRIVFTRSGSLAADRRVVTTASQTPTLAVVGQAAAAAAAARLEPAGVRVLAAADLASALRALRATGIDALLVEGGGTLAGTLLQAGLVDRLYWIQAPRWLGRGVPAFDTGAATPLDDAHAWTVVERRPLGADTLMVIDRELCLPGS